MTSLTLYVSPGGDDSFDGSLPERNGENGPLRTLNEAIRRLAGTEWQKQGDARIVLRAGRHELEQPLTLTPELCGGREWMRETGYEKIPINERCLHFEAFPGEQPVISGARAITDWTEELYNGRKVWVANVAALLRTGLRGRQLFINGQRRPRARWPKQGFLRVRDVPGWTPAADPDRPAWMQGQDHFRFFPGELGPWQNRQDAEVIFLQRWIESRTGFRDINFVENYVQLDRPAQYSLIHDGVDPEQPEGARFYVENVLDELSEPGEWVLARARGLLYYLPRPGEEPSRTEALFPVLPYLLAIRGSGNETAFGVRCDGITFAHTEWDLPAGVAGSPQAACVIPGSVILDHAVGCEFRHCSFTGTAAYGVEMLEGADENLLEHCTFTDLGGGGVKIWHGCRRNRISDCEIRDGGKIFHSGAGILVGQAAGNCILRNHIHHLYYTGISVGWVWGYKESESYGNIVEYNHVHDIGNDWLSDMGGIYLLGIAPGTRVRFNVVHDVRSAVYGGVGIYPDEGSTDLLIEGNLVFACRSFLFSQNYGRGNVVRHNLFSGGEENQLALHRIEPGKLALIFEDNVLDYHRGATFCGGYMNRTLDPDTVIFRNNWYCPQNTEAQFMEMDFAAWQKAGMDNGSAITGPTDAAFNAARKRILSGLRGVPGLDAALKQLRGKIVSGKMMKV